MRGPHCSAHRPKAVETIEVTMMSDPEPVVIEVPVVDDPVIPGDEPETDVESASDEPVIGKPGRKTVEK